jgi:hypothetical protein
MPSGFARPLKVTTPFDPERAGRTLGELEALSPDILRTGAFVALIGSAAGNSPYLARLMLKDAPYLARLLADGPEGSLAALEARRWRWRRKRSPCGGCVSRERRAAGNALADIDGISISRR